MITIKWLHQDKPEVFTVIKVPIIGHIINNNNIETEDGDVTTLPSSLRKLTSNGVKIQCNSQNSNERNGYFENFLVEK